MIAVARIVVVAVGRAGLRIAMYAFPAGGDDEGDDLDGDVEGDDLGGDDEGDDAVGNGSGGELVARQLAATSPNSLQGNAIADIGVAVDIHVVSIIALLSHCCSFLLRSDR